MAFILALVVGIAVIAGIVAYWVMMAALFVGGLILAFWILVFTYFLSDKPELAVVGVIVATGLSIWLMAKDK